MAEDEKPYSMLTDVGIRNFMIESDSFYPPNAVDLSIEQQRSLYNKMSAHFRKERPDNIKVEDRFVVSGDFEIPVRIYSPNSSTPLPVMLYLHGGGYVVGDLESHDDICAEIADRAQVCVVTAAYRLAPEHKFPAAFNDCKALLSALPDLGSEFGFDCQHLVVGGDSAGGNLAAGLCLDARDSGSPKISGQVLIYPGLGGDGTKGSYISQAHAPGLSAKDSEFYRNIYVGPSDHPNRNSKFALPLLETNYANLPPAFLVAAHFDPLRDDCSNYADCLKNAGVDATVRDEPELVHAFLRARHMSKPASQSFDAIITAIKSLAHEGKLP